MSDQAIVYEVTASVEPEYRAAYERFMESRHIPDLLATGWFTSATFETSGPGRYRMRYVAPSRHALSTYLAEQAPRLRADLTDHFPNGVELSREEWIVIRCFA